MFFSSGPKMAVQRSVLDRWPGLRWPFRFRKRSDWLPVTASLRLGTCSPSLSVSALGVPSKSSSAAIFSPCANTVSSRKTRALAQPSGQVDVSLTNTMSSRKTPFVQLKGIMAAFEGLFGSPGRFRSDVSTAASSTSWPSRHPRKIPGRVSSIHIFPHDSFRVASTISSEILTQNGKQEKPGFFADVSGGRFVLEFCLWGSSKQLLYLSALPSPSQNPLLCFFDSLFSHVSFRVASTISSEILTQNGKQEKPGVFADVSGGPFWLEFCSVPVPTPVALTGHLLFVK